VPDILDISRACPFAREKSHESPLVRKDLTLEPVLESVAHPRTIVLQPAADKLERV